ncbi:MAG: protoglobin domain-containing protein [Thalassobaculum sp.]
MSDDRKPYQASSSVQNSAVYKLVTSRILENFESRLKLDSIDEYTRQKLRMFQPTIDLEMSDILADFYQHMKQFPQAEKYLAGRDVNYLKLRQSQHWNRLFSATFNEDYISSAVRVGLVHHKIGLPLFLYLSGYNRVQCDLTALAIKHHAGTLAATDTVSAIIKAVAIDMDIAISCYFLAENLRLRIDDTSRKLV